MNKEKKIIFFVAASCLIWAFFAFSRFQIRGSHEWDQSFARHEFQRRAILEYHQIPLWGPYFCGGEPWLAHPDSDFLSPFFLAILIFGTIKGTIIMVFLHALAGTIGMYRLSRFYGLGSVLSFLNCVFLLNMFNILCYVGSFNTLGLSLLPWIYLFFCQGIKKDRISLFSSFLLALTIYSGSIYVFIISSFVLTIHGLITLLGQKTIRQVSSAIKVIFIAVILSSPKLLPMAEFLNQYKRTIILPPWAGFFNLDHIKAGILQIGHFFSSGDNVYSWGMFMNEGVGGYNFDAVSIFLLVSGCFVLWKKFKALVAMNVIFLLLALGDNSPLNIWRIFHSLFSSFKGAHKFFGGLLFSCSLTLGLSVEWFQSRFLKREKAKYIFSLCMLTLVSYGVFSNASKMFMEEGTIDYRLRPEKAEFTQSFEDNNKMFESIYNNRGIVNAYDNVGDQIKTMVITRQKEEYNGEYFLKAGNGKVKKLLFSPNKLVFNVDLFSEDALIINQNFFSGWHSTMGSIINSDGLLGVRLKKGQAMLSLYYLPFSFVMGIIICAFSIFYYVRNCIGWRAITGKG